MGTRRTGAVAIAVVVAVAGYAAGVVAGLIATATLEPWAGASLAGLAVQLVAALSCVVAVGLAGRSDQHVLRLTATATATASTLAYVALVLTLGAVLGAVALHAAVVVGVTTYLLHQDVERARRAPGSVAGNHGPTGA